MYKKTEQIRNPSQRHEAAQTVKFMIKIDCLGTYGAYFRTDLKRLAHKILMLKSHFKLVGRKFVRCFIALRNFKKFALSPSKRVANLYFSK